MYEAHWGLREKPFENTPDPRFFYRSAQHEEAFFRMLYCIRERKGAGMLTGIFGCGKTVIGYVVMEELLKERYRCAFVTNPRLCDLDFLRMVAYQLGGSVPSANKTDVLIALQEMLTNSAREGKETILIVDEAHTIGEEAVFEELRLLLNFQWKDRFLVTVLLFGQPELARKIEQFQPLEQRLNIKSALGALSPEETKGYIVHRLSVAGHPRPEGLFSEQALRLIHDYSGGIPRRINRLCDMCLLAGFGAHVDQLEEGLVSEEIRALSALAA